MVVAVVICVCALLFTWGIRRAADFIGCRVGQRWAAILAVEPGDELAAVERGDQDHEPGRAACSHSGALPVDTLDGERVAWLCPDCDRQLPAAKPLERTLQ